jgi:hypothetical protein
VDKKASDLVSMTGGLQLIVTIEEHGWLVYLKASTIVAYARLRSDLNE